MGISDMATGRFVVYYRVSTAKQGRSGLGLEAQQDAVKGYLNGGGWKIVGELQEVESGKNRNRPQLAEALRLCRVHRATLLVAKQDRLSRNAAQIMGMLDDAKVPFVCVDDPNTTKLNVGLKALIAEDEADKASVRTKAALAVARARGVQLGGQRGEWRVATVASKAQEASLEARRAKAQAHKADLMPMIEDIQAAGITSLLGIAGQLNERGAVTARGTEDNPGTWTATQVKRILEPA
jgi:DNA invertase Pin-like site-specific DNA recombinase